ncbi:MAG: 4-hydroxyphenyl-beta-ketoacyl-CoA hydrolase [Sphingomonas sp. SCN 67-18]|uniref:amidohydrolase family protein n=1 Tax=uncultured Sphingomonas sp. TaxID=158754 RepID=UPI00086DF1ED|nr:amidohydrolase family protein [Sphingomonas sp. SCN 67-18]ODU22953.1 MAG: 4-hydroxyphenyl-beta-ketoacyl-CoA hydrolase [Sphingomonas sp. SCN 67-18]
MNAAARRAVFAARRAIDVHVHAEVSCHHAEDPIFAEFADAATRYFKADRNRPTIAETVAHYRAQDIGFVMFTVDMEAGTGIRRIANEEIAEAAAENSDIMIAFASIDPHKGKRGALEARRLIEDHGVRGFKFHPPLQNFDPGDPIAWPLYEVIAHYRLPAIFHTGHSGMGTGMRGGGGVRLKYGQPMLVDDVAVAFPDMPIILAHPGWPWTDESLSMALHKPNVFIDLSGWSPRHFPPQIMRYANGQLGHKFLFGSDFPLIPPERWIAAFGEAGFKPEVHEPILRANALNLLFPEE